MNTAKVDCRFFLPLLLALSSTAACFAQKSNVDFATQVNPLLQKYCAGCHNDADPEGEFSVSSLQALRRGGENGQVFVAGNSHISRLVQMLTGAVEPRMPPEDEPQPTAGEIALITNWIDAGAPAPTTADVATSVFTAAKVPAADNVAAAVTAVDWSLNNVIAVGRFRGVTLIDGTTQQIIRRLDGFPGKINSVRFSTDGLRLAVASGIVGVAGQASIWSVIDGTRQVVVDGHRDTIYQAVVSPDDRWLATAGYDRRVVIWDAQTGDRVRAVTGHNDAVYDLDFSHDSRILISASGDQTIKVWNVGTGDRWDTLGQPLKEQLATRFSPDNRVIVGGGRDHRIRVWEFASREKPQINPLLHARFAHDGPIVALAFSPDGSRLISSAEDGTIKVWETTRFSQLASIENQSDMCAALAVSPDGSSLYVGRMDGSTQLIKLPKSKEVEPPTAHIASGTVVASSGVEARENDESEPNDSPDTAGDLEIPAVVTGRIHRDASELQNKDVDLFRFHAQAGQSLIFETRAARDKSPLDSRLEILDLDGHPVPQIVLQAIRDSYFTFRGKDSNIIKDFRIHNWEEMKLNDYLYASGEVVKLFQHPRGPDSGFNVYPGYGSRYTFFGTTPMAHALHEPCYIVQPFPVGSALPPNELPVFELNYENDDDPLRKFGKDSRLHFTAPYAGQYLVRVSDVRGVGGENFAYKLEVRDPAPDFSILLNYKKEIHRGSGQEFSITADRRDGFVGEITVDISDIPAALHITSPLTIEANHNIARGTMHLKADAEPPAPEEFARITLRATATIGNSTVERDAGRFGDIVVHDKPKVQIRIVRPEDDEDRLFDSDPAAPLVLEVIAGRQIEAKVVANRLDHDDRISFGQEDAGRNLPHGVYVDNIGLNGLMITRGQTAQRFAITAENWVRPTTHSFHVRAKDVEGQAAWPVIIKVVAADDRQASE